MATRIGRRQDFAIVDTGDLSFGGAQIGRHVIFEFVKMVASNHKLYISEIAVSRRFRI